MHLRQTLIPPRGLNPDADAHAHARQLVNNLGVGEASKRLGLSRATLTAFLSGVQVNNGTKALIELALYRAHNEGNKQ